MSSQFLDKSQSAENKDTNRPNILLIEDNEADAFLVQQALKQHDVPANLKILRDGEEASDFFDAVQNGMMTCPELVILDLNLPKMSGHEVLEKMRNGDICRGVPVVVLSSSTVLADTKKSKLLGVACHIQKPSDLEEFMKIGAVFKSLLTGPAA